MVELTKLLYDSQATFIFNEKHHFVAGSKNYKEDKPAMQMAQVPHCKLVVYDELVEETRHVSLGSLVGDPYEQHHK
jgi:hypothetical protein